MAFLWNRKKQTQLCVHQAQDSEESTSKGEQGVEVKQPGSRVPAAGVVEVDPGAGIEISPPATKDSKGRCQTCRQEKLAARRYRWRIIAGLIFPFALQALDVTIIASALSWIASYFDEVSQMNWIISAFNLTSAAFIPFWGQMADIFGRHTALQLTLALMMIGSGLCVGAPKNGFPVLILGRAIQGLAAAGINVCCKVIIADKVSLKENAKNTSIFSFFAGMSYAVGPLIGGFLTNNDWRWCFKINLPVAGAGIICVFFILRTQLLGPQPLPELVAQDGGLERTQKFKARILTIDFGGQFLFLFGLGLLILAFTWGGKSYPWSSVHVVVPLVLGALLSLCFVLWQALMAPGRYLSRKLPLQRPTIPWELLTQRNMALLFYINFATGMAMTAVLYFVNIYFVFVKGYRPSDAGVQLLFYTPGIGIGVYFAMVMCNFYPRQTFLPLCLGSIIEATGISVLAWALHNGHHVTISFMMGFTGAGTGLRIMPGTLHGIGFFPNNIAAVISMMSFAVPFGSATSMTIMDTVFNNKAGISQSWNFSTTSGVSFFGSLAFIPAGLKQEIIDQIRDAIVLAFVAILPFMWLCVFASFWLGNVRITRNKKVDKEGRVDFSENVIESVFVWSLIRGWLGKEKGVRNEVMEKGNGEENNGQQTSTEVKGMVV